MTKICKFCSEIIKGDVLEHYREKHFSIYFDNKSKIESHPGAFALNVGLKVSKSIYNKETSPIDIKKEKVHKKIKKRKVHKTDKSIPTAHAKKMCFLDIFRHAYDEQTYRSQSFFECDGCHKEHKYGKVIYGNSHNLHLCYECYKYAKKNTDSKRGNKHVFINTPM